METTPQAVTVLDSAPTPINLSELSREDRQIWRDKGTLPDATPTLEVKETPAAAPDEKDASSEAAETAADSGTAKPQKKGAADRIQELLAERKRDREELQEVKRRLTELAAPRDSKQEAQPAAEVKPEAKTEPKLEDLDDKGNPRFKTYEEYLAAVRKYDRDALLAEFESRTAKSQKEAQDKQQKDVLNQEWGKRVTAARAKHADFDEIALNPELPIKQGSVTDVFILESEHGTEVLYHLGKNPAELERISALNPIAQARELVKIEQGFIDPPKPSVPPITRAPKPPSEVGGRGTTPDDALLSAAQAGTKPGGSVLTNEYKAEANRRYLARNK